MVLVQEYFDNQEHVVYYLIKNIVDAKTLYSHVDKLASATVIFIQSFHHYIFSAKQIPLQTPAPCTISYLVKY